MHYWFKNVMKYLCKIFYIFSEDICWIYQIPADGEYYYDKTSSFMWWHINNFFAAAAIFSRFALLMRRSRKLKSSCETSRLGTWEWYFWKNARQGTDLPIQRMLFEASPSLAFFQSCNAAEFSKIKVNMWNVTKHTVNYENVILIEFLYSRFIIRLHKYFTHTYTYIS